MKIRFGAVGSPAFLALLDQLRTESDSDIVLFSYQMETPAGLPNLIEQYHSEIDIWILDDPDCFALVSANGTHANIHLAPVEATEQLPSLALMRQFLRALKYEEKTKRLEKSQIAVQIVQVANFNQLMDKESTLFYDVYRLYLKTQELLLSYTERVFGSYVSIGNGRFMIFSTRGIMETNYPAATLLLHQIDHLTHLSANIGMGYGVTALEAEKNARLALNYAERSASENCIFLVDENGSVRGPLQEQNEIAFTFRTENPDLMNKLQAAKISIATFEKMLSVQNASHQKTITASTVADLLHMSERNARKILATLQNHDLAQIVGLEIPTSKGRPRQVFKIRES